MIDMDLRAEVAVAKRLPMEGPWEAGTKAVAARRYINAVSCWHKELHKQWCPCSSMTPCTVWPPPMSVTVSWLARLCTAAEEGQGMCSIKPVRSWHCKWFLCAYSAESLVCRFLHLCLASWIVQQSSSLYEAK